MLRLSGSSVHSNEGFMSSSIKGSEGVMHAELFYGSVYVWSRVRLGFVCWVVGWLKTRLLCVLEAIFVLGLLFMSVVARKGSMPWVRPLPV